MSVKALRTNNITSISLVVLKFGPGVVVFTGRRDRHGLVQLEMGHAPGIRGVKRTLG
jgi:hypothetical protein